MLSCACPGLISTSVDSCDFLVLFPSSPRIVLSYDSFFMHPIYSSSSVHSHITVRSSGDFEGFCPDPPYAEPKRLPSIAAPFAIKY
jgi:hypothetical protein